jgi:hypothetical protein
VETRESNSTSSRKIDCFEVQNRMTDAIDGLLSPKMRSAFDMHISQCDECSTQSEHIRELIHVLHQQPRVAMPLEIREDPLSFPIRRMRRVFSNPRQVWKDLPVAIRLLVEGLSIALVVVLGIRLGPIAREMYETRMERKLQKLIAAEDLSNQEIPLLRGRGEADDADITDEVANSEVEDSAGVDVASEIHVGKAEIWRFNLKTDAPTLVRGQILKALRETGVPETTAGLGGVEAPGGIQFDILVPVAVIAPLKIQLEHLAGKPSENLPFSETFTWYKNRSKKPIPNGMSRLVIWLSQI